MNQVKLKNKRIAYTKLSGKATDLLMNRYINPEEEYHSYTVDIDSRISMYGEIQNISSNILNELNSGAGYLLIRLPESAIGSSHDIKIAFWNLFTCFAKPLVQFRNGNMLHDVRKSDEHVPPRCSYSMSDKGASLHTDGSYMYECPPNYVGLICINQAESGGESILVDGRKILQQLKKEYPESMKNLKHDFHFNTDNQLEGSVTLTKPIISENDSSIIFNYNRIHIESGHNAVGLPLPNESIDSMNKLDLLLKRKENQNIFRLSRGEMLVINNHFILHGRYSFKDNENKDSKRLMIRIWGEPVVIISEYNMG